MDIKFSIVIPVHNKELYLKHTLESVLFQTHDEFELILVDDGSTDNSGIICDQYALKESRIKVVHQQNAGVSAARNTGIRAAQYSLIAFIDADDFWDCTFLEQMQDLISVFPEVSLYSSRFARILNNKIILSENPSQTNNELIKFNLIDKCCNKGRFPIHTSSVIIKKEAIESVGFFDERISVFEDYDLFLKISLFSDIGYLNRKPLSFYNIDVPTESKARGLIPEINKNWISYLDKFDNELEHSTNLKLFLDRFRLNQIVTYRKHKEYKIQVLEIFSKIDKSNYGWKYKIIFILPICLTDFALLSYGVYVKLKGLFQ